jgi:hypothetical protein
MNTPEKTLTDSLRFQLSLLNLAVVPHGTPKTNSGKAATTELARLAKHVQPRRVQGNKRSRC